MIERRDADGGPFFNPRRYPTTDIRRGDRIWRIDGTASARFVGWSDEFVGRAVVDFDGVEAIVPLFLWER